MKYCVVKGTATIIDGSDNPPEIMAQNAQNAGITDFEILTEEEYQARKASEPVPPPQPTQEERLEVLEAAMLEVILGG